MERVQVRARNVRPNGDDATLRCHICLDDICVSLAGGGSSYDRLAQCAACKNVLHRRCLRRARRIDVDFSCPVCRIAWARDESWDFGVDVLSNILDECDGDYAPSPTTMCAHSPKVRHSHRLVERRAQDRKSSMRPRVLAQV